MEKQELKEVNETISACIDKVAVIDQVFKSLDQGGLENPSLCFWGGMRTISSEVSDKLGRVSSLLG